MQFNDDAQLDTSQVQTPAVAAVGSAVAAWPSAAAALDWSG
jgi:hypothetical protein